MATTWKVSPLWTQDVLETHHGVLPVGNNSTIGTNLDSWYKFKDMLQKYTTAGKVFSSPAISTYSLIYTSTTGTDYFYYGGVLNPDGDLYFIPSDANRGQKIAANGTVSTYSLVYTIPNAYVGGVLAPNGSIHFVPDVARVGQKIDIDETVSTYSLVYTTNSAYAGGVLAPNGDIHFIPNYAAVGQKIDASGTVSTYSLVYTTSGAYYGGVLSPKGEIHFVPSSVTCGQKINTDGTVSTYSLIVNSGYKYGVLSPNGDIHFVPYSATVGQKINIDGVVSTYSLIYTGGATYGGVLSPSGEVIFMNPEVMQTIDVYGVINTYFMRGVFGLGVNAYTYEGLIVNFDGDIIAIPQRAGTGLKISIFPTKTFDPGICCSPYFNKF